jgi:hypothetical protein
MRGQKTHYASLVSWKIRWVLCLQPDELTIQ